MAVSGTSPWTIARLRAAAPAFARAVKTVAPEQGPSAPITADVLERALEKLRPGSIERAVAQKLIASVVGASAAVRSPTPVAAAITAAQASIVTPPEPNDWTKGVQRVAQTVAQQAGVFPALPLSNGKILVYTENGNAIWDPATNEVTPSSVPRAPKYMLSRDRAVVSQGSVYGLDGSALFNFCRSVQHVKELPDGTFVGSSYDSVDRYDAYGNRRVELVARRQAQGIDTAGDKVVVLTDNEIRVFEPGDSAWTGPRHTLRGAGTLHAMCVLDADRLVVHCAKEPTTRVCRLNGDTITSFNAGSYAKVYALSPEHFIVQKENGFDIWDIHGNRLASETTSQLKDITVLRDGRFLTRHEGELMIWGVKTNVV